MFRKYWFGLFIAVALLTIFYNATYIRPMADDYCYGFQGMDKGAWDAMVHWYEVWSGRYSFSIIASVVLAAGQWTAPLTPLVLFIAWLVSISWILYSARLVIWESVLAAAVLIFAILTLTPMMEQSFYWTVGALTYTLPLVGFCFYLGLLGHNPRINSGILSLISLMITFVLAGLSEAYAAMQITTLVIMLVFFRKHTSPIAAGIIGSIMGVIVVASAPGNEARLAAMPPRLPLPEVIVESFKHTVYTIVRQTNILHPERILALAAAFGIGRLLGAKVSLSLAETEGSRVKPLKFFILSALVTLLIMWAGILPSYYAQASAPPERLLIMPLFALVCLMFGWGVKSREILSLKNEKLGQILQVGVMGVLVLAGIREAIVNLQHNDDYRTFAESWQQRHEVLASAPPTAVLTFEPLKVDEIKLARLSALSRRETYWVNECMADYYGIALVSDPQTPEYD